jgi:DNA-binding IclR family transcriptional regulator
MCKPYASCLCTGMESLPMATSKKRATNSTKPSGSYASPALDKGLDVLEMLAHESSGMTKSEIARALGRTVSEIFRMLVCLERRGYIAQAEGDERYSLSLKLFKLAHEHPPTERLLTEALPRMRAIAEETQQSCHLGVLESHQVAILAQANASNSIGLFVKAGSTVDLMKAATGQVILAHLPDDARGRVLERWKAETGSRLPSDLLQHLDRIRARGYEKRASYQVTGVTNVSFPVRDANGHAIAAITVPHIRRADGGSSIADVERILAKFAAEISKTMGAT